MRKVLVPVNDLDDARMRAAIAEVISIYREESVQVHLLNVQVCVSSHVSMFFKSGELRAIHHEAGMQELAPAKAALDTAGVPYATHVEVGRRAETIARLAQEIGCDRIVMGRSEQKGFADKLFGSLAGQVRHLVDVTGNCKVIGS
jgi:nucleotide-binding universal stress UspA family protein